MRSHDGLLDLAVAAGRTGDESAFDLLVIGRGIRKPAFERMAFGADERVENHRVLPTARNGTGLAMGSAISKRRPCCSDGTRPRALATSAGSIVAMTMPGSVPPSATIWPHGSTINE